MKKMYLFWVMVSVAVMVLFPLAAVTFMKGDSGAAASLFLFFTLNPLYSVILGIGSAFHIKKLWSLPIVSGVLFLAGAWSIFSFGDMAFVLYALFYIFMGMLAMVLFYFLKKKML